MRKDGLRNHLLRVHKDVYPAHSDELEEEIANSITSGKAAPKAQYTVQNHDGIDHIFCQGKTDFGEACDYHSATKKRFTQHWVGQKARCTSRSMSDCGALQSRSHGNGSRSKAKAITSTRDPSSSTTQAANRKTAAWHPPVQSMRRQRQGRSQQRCKWTIPQNLPFATFDKRSQCHGRKAIDSARRRLSKFGSCAGGRTKTAAVRRTVIAMKCPGAELRGGTFVYWIPKSALHARSRKSLHCRRHHPICLSGISIML